MSYDRRALLRTLGLAAGLSLPGCSDRRPEGSDPKTATDPSTTAPAATTAAGEPATEGANEPEEPAEGRSAPIERLAEGELVAVLAPAATDRTLAEAAAAGDVEVGKAETQPTLTADGRADARAVGDAVRRSEVSVAAVATSELWRARDTALLAFDAAAPDPALTPALDGSGPTEAGVARLRERLSAPPTDGTNTAVVTDPRTLAAVAADLVPAESIAEGGEENGNDGDSDSPDGSGTDDAADVERIAESGLDPGEAAVIAPGNDPALVGTLRPDEWAGAASATADGEVSDGGAAAGAVRSSYRIRRGSDDETPLVRVDGPEPGPTMVVVGGVHGDEESGWRAAERATEWPVESGTLIVIPRANAPAVERGTRNFPDWVDLNRQFPPGEPPRTPLARGIWRAVVRHDPDGVLDLHSSDGIYGEDEFYVGQNVFRTEGLRPEVEAAVTRLNEDRVPADRPEYEFVHNGAGSEKALLTIKANRDLGAETALFEVTTRELPLQTRVEWTAAFVRAILSLWGMVAPTDEERRSGSWADEERQSRVPTGVE